MPGRNGGGEMPRGYDTLAAEQHLRRDRRLARWMDRIGPITAQPQWRRPFDPVDALARAILYQQLHGKAAATIVARVETAIDSTRLHGETLSRIDDAALRACGVSGNKMLALRDLCAREAAGTIPSVRRMAHMDDAAIIAALVPVRGIGRWTVEMLLMFRLGRPDILPVDDFGVRKGIQVLDNSDAMPTPRQAADRGTRWGPYRTQAAFHLWRIADAAKGDAGKDTPRSQT